MFFLSFYTAFKIHSIFTDTLGALKFLKEQRFDVLALEE